MAVIWILLAFIVVWIALSYLPTGLDGHAPLPYIITFVPFLWIPACVLGLISIGFGSIGTAIVAFLVALWSVRRRFHYWRHLRTTNQPASASPFALTVMTLNCRFGQANAQAIVDAVREHNVDVLALQELGDSLVGALETAGLREVLPYWQLGVGNPNTDNGGFNGLFSRRQPTSSAANAAVIEAADTPVMTFGTDADALMIVSAHTKSPMRGCVQWSSTIRGLGSLATAHPNVVLMGDMNASVEHPSFRALLASGFVDADIDLSAGHHPTWPSWLVWPRLILDHILLSPTMGANFVTSFAVTGTDHLALVAAIHSK